MSQEMVSLYLFGQEERGEKALGEFLAERGVPPHVVELVMISTAGAVCLGQKTLAWGLDDGLLTVRVAEGT